MDNLEQEFSSLPSLLKQDAYYIFAHHSIPARVIMTPLHEIACFDEEEYNQLALPDATQKINHSTAAPYGLLYNSSKKFSSWIKINTNGTIKRSSFNPLSEPARESDGLSKIMVDVGVFECVLVENENQIPTGIVVPQDLNKPGMRAFLYQFYITLELYMLDHIEKIDPKEEWQKILYPDEIKKLKDTNTQNGAQTPTLINCLEFSQSLRILNNWAGKADSKYIEWAPRLQGQYLHRQTMVNLRHDLMHPRRQIVSGDVQSVKLLRRKYEYLLLMINDLKKML